MTHTPSQIKAMLDAATPGRLKHGYGGTSLPCVLTDRCSISGDNLLVASCTNEADAELFAAAPTIIREQQEEISALISRVRELERGKECVWEKEDGLIAEFSPGFFTSCGDSVTAQYTTGFIYCPRCGGRIVRKDG